MTTAAITAATAEVVRRTVAIEMLFDGGPVRVNGSPFDISFGGVTFTGIGGLGALSAAQETSELRAYDMTFTLSGIPRDAIALALTEPYQGRGATIWEVHFDEAWQVVADPVVIFRGRMDQLNPSLGEAATVSVRMVNRLADWERPRGSYYTDQEQQRLHSGDKGLAFVAATTEKTIRWPAASYTGA